MCPDLIHVIDAIRAQARVRPNKTALADSHISLDYAGLERFSAQFARHLRSRGCRPGDRVVMLANRRAIPVAAILGVFKAGAIHVPLDPRMPAGRLEYILRDIVPALVITEAELCDFVAARLPEGVPVEAVADLERWLEEDPPVSDSAGPEYAPRFESLAYCIYTSGSTGRPKGVLIDHRALSAFFQGTPAVYDVDADSICASFSPLHFDVYTMDMLFPLTRGAELHVHDDIVAPELLLATIRDQAVSHFSAWGLMLGLIAQAADFDQASLTHVKTILTGTDVPDIKIVQRWLCKSAGIKVINAYGPTEVTCAATAHVIGEIEPDRQRLYPIGRPLQQVQAFLIGADGTRIDAADVPGELLLGGPQVMRGYWNMPGETAAKIVEFDGVRCYRTGDLCRYLPEGGLFYIGRKDNEVNIGGYRVHLNEIQRVINTVPRVHASETVLILSDYDEKILAAAVLIERGHEVDVDRQIELIRRRLAAELPAYMVPRFVSVLDAFPRLSSGKPDRQALRLILERLMSSQKQEVMAP